MAFVRKENQTPDVDIPYESYPNKSLYIHGSTGSRAWRTKLISDLSEFNILLLDPWKNSWNSYVGGLENELEEIQALASEGISGGTGGEGTGIVDGYTPIVVPDINNTPHFWEKRNSDACDFHFFVFDSDTEIANHIVIQMIDAIKTHKNKVVVHIAKTDWRINYSIFLKDLPRENYFGNLENAIARLKTIMDL